MRLILVRHGETDWNKQRRVQGLGDIGLNEKGKKQAEALALSLEKVKIDAIYSSPLRRAQETARAIARFHDVEVETLDELSELDAGELDGLTPEEMKERHGAFLKDWGADAAAVRLPGGGSLAELQDQVWKGMEKITGKHRDTDDTVVVVTHFFSSLCIVCKAIGLSLSNYRRLKMDVAATCILDLNPQGMILSCLNDTSHLKAVS